MLTELRIVDVRSHVLLDPVMDPEATSSAQDTYVVEIVTDGGLVGVGETDLSPWIARACVEAPTTHTMARGLKEMLVGESLDNIDALVDRLYVGSAHSGRRGAGVAAIGALEVALRDLEGKSLGVPTRAVLSPSSVDRVTPYASLQPEPTEATFEAYVEELLSWATSAKRDGFRAMKLEATFTGPYAHLGMAATDSQVVELIGAVRSAVGREIAIMVDMQYAFMHDLDRCLKFLRACEQHDLYFVEAPLWPDDLDSYRTLSRSQGTPIASGEWLGTRHEFEELLDHGEVAVAQPDIGRVGGLREAIRVAEMAADRGALVIPHAWKTELSIAAASQFAAVVDNCPFIEYLAKDLSSSPMRRELADSDLKLEAGQLILSRRPGIGVELNYEAMAKYEAVARQFQREVC